MSELATTAAAPGGLDTPGPVPDGDMPPARSRVLNSLSRIFAMLLLPLSIAPVLLLGPSMLRAPVALGHEAWGEVQRLERALQPGRVHHPTVPPRLGPSTWRPVVSLGSVYGRWSAFPTLGYSGFQRDAGDANVERHPERTTP